MPPEWYQFKPNEIDEENDDEETKARKRLNQKIVVDKKPYFFNYVYPERLKAEKQYKSSADRKAIYQFNLTLEELFEHEKEGTLTHSQEEFLRYYYLQLPSSNNACVMNKICWMIEDEFDGWVGRENKNVPFDHTLLKTDKPYNASVYRQIKGLYDLYVKIVERMKTENKTYKRQTPEQGQIEILKIKENFKSEALKLCSNEEDLTNMILDFCYGKGGSKRFAWDLCGPQILEHLLQKKNREFSIFVADDSGDLVFKGLTFKEVKKQVGGEV